MKKKCIICQSQYDARRIDQNVCSRDCYRERERRAQKLRRENFTVEQKEIERIRNRPKRIKTNEQKEQHRKRSRDRYRNFTLKEKEQHIKRASEWIENCRLTNPNHYKKYLERGRKRSRERYIRQEAALKICQELGINI